MRSSIAPCLSAGADAHRGLRGEMGTLRCTADRRTMVPSSPGRDLPPS